MTTRLDDFNRPVATRLLNILKLPIGEYHIREYNPSTQAHSSPARTYSVTSERISYCVRSPEEILAGILGATLFLLVGLTNVIWNSEGEPPSTGVASFQIQKFSEKGRGNLVRWLSLIHKLFPYPNYLIINKKLNTREYIWGVNSASQD